MKKFFKGLAVLAAVFVITGGCLKEKAIEEKNKISISGAWALYPMVVKWAEEYKKVNPDVQIDISAGGAGKGMADALSGVVDLGMVSRDINPAEIEKGAWWVSVVKDAVVPMINSKNPLADQILKKGIKKDQFIAMWKKGSVKNWNSIIPGGKDQIALHVYTRSDACGAAEIWAKYLGCKQEDLKGTGVYGDPGLAEAVRNDNLGIGFNNINFAYDPTTKIPVEGIVPAPIDLNNNGSIDADEDFYKTRDSITEAIANNKYPSPPARNLHLVAKALPGKESVIAFLNWILKEGQKAVPDAGYINLPYEKLKEEIEKLAKKSTVTRKP
ncbi:MAG: substrate-binding domain-containing protein [Spirochaetes bacterium]|jgi:phosphate transport system substrate-binding protein|nr:substrate-binding domain-containing protein [Spirochaetota bacterium]